MISIYLSTVHQQRVGQIAIAIDSVLKQTFEDFELIICADASEDETANYLKRQAEADSRIKVFRNKTAERSASRCHALCAEASDPSRPFFTFLSADSSLLPRALKALIDPLLISELVDFTFGSILEYESNDSFQRDQRNLDGERTLGESRLSGVLIRKSQEKKLGWFDGSILFQPFADSDYWNRLAQNGLGQCVHRDVARWSKGVRKKALQADLLEVAHLYRELRDKDRWPLTREACRFHPQDKVPVGPWTRAQLKLIFSIFVKYFFETGELETALEWATRLEAKLDDPLVFPHGSVGGKQTEATTITAFRCGMAFGIEKSERIALSLSEREDENRNLAEQLSKSASETQSLSEECRTLQCQLEFASSAALRIEQLERELLESRIELSAIRHRLVDRINLVLKKPPFVHRVLKACAMGGKQTLRILTR